MKNHHEAMNKKRYTNEKRNERNDKGKKSTRSLHLKIFFYKKKWKGREDDRKYRW